MSTIQFPCNTSKLQSNSLKKPPKPIDWIQQSYLEMIQDVSFSANEQVAPPKPIVDNTKKTITIHLNEQKAYTHFSSIQEEEPSLVEDHDSGKLLVQKEEGEEDDISECCYTYTTSSTDYNRKNNVFQFYREQQQNMVCPIDEELTFSGIQQQELSIQEQKPEISNKPVAVKKYKTKFKKIGRLITEKMRQTAEKPFWSIDNRF